jgi:DNA replication protein DnaC
MEHHSRHLRLVRPTDEDQIATLQETVDSQHGGDFRAYVIEKYPRLALMIPSDVTVAQFAHTDGYAPYAEQVIGLCAKCPQHGGRCDDGDASDRLTHPGQQPYWEPSTNAIGTKLCDRWSAHELRSQLSVAGVADRLLNCRLDNFSFAGHVAAAAKVVAVCSQYAEEFPTPKEYAEGTLATNLLLFGEDTGVGKTHLAVAVIAQLIKDEKIPRAKFSMVSSLLESIRDSYDSRTTRSVLRRYCTAPVLVLDDLGAHRVNDWVREQMLVIIDYRWGKGLATVMTTNSGPEVIGKSLGERATSRLFGRALSACVSGDDHRWR